MGIRVALLDLELEQHERGELVWRHCGEVVDGERGRGAGGAIGSSQYRGYSNVPTNKLKFTSKFPERTTFRRKSISLLGKKQDIS